MPTCPPADALDFKAIEDRQPSIRIMQWTPSIRHGCASQLKS
jgi:hypothetical protein